MGHRRELERARLPHTRRDGLCRAAIAASLALSNGLPATARADAAVERVSLRYVAPERCPSESDFLGRIAKRTGRFALGSDHEARTFEVVLTPGNDKVDGLLTSIDASGWRATQAVTGTTCDEVASAIAFIVALAIDPNANAEALPASPPPRPAPPPPPVRASAGRPDGRARLAGEAHALVLGGAAPDLMFGGEAFVRGELGAGPFRQEVRVGVAYAASYTTTIPSVGSARFTLATGTLELCAVHGTVRGVTFSPCARLDVGSVHGQGFIAHARSNAGLWVDVAALGDIRWMLGRWVFLTGNAGPHFPIDSVRFYFQESTQNPAQTTIHAPARIGLMGAIGGGVYFP